MIYKTILQLALQPGIGMTTLARLYVTGREQLPILRGMGSDTIVNQYKIAPRQAAFIYAALNDDTAYLAHESWCAANNVRAILLGDPEYPELLAHIGAPPVVIWVKGKLPTTDASCALVGSRDANHYGKRAVHMLVPALVAQNIATISGGARGIDTFVHEETIKAGGKTVAVMGCGLAHTYPAEHYELFARIVASGGALLSPFPPQTPPVAGLFPVRNRIIAGLSNACIVVQAAAKSGALITATHALEENREVGAVPGPIDDRLAAGTNDLLRQGAHVVVDGATAVELCGKKAERITHEAFSRVEDPGKMALLRLLTRPKSFDELLEEYNGASAMLQELLFVLQLAGKVAQNHAGLWMRCD